MPGDGRRAALPELERRFVAHLLQEAPGLADAVAVAKRLHRLLRRDSQESLDQALNAEAGVRVAEFAAGLCRGLTAVQAAFDLPWTTSLAEDQINRLKMLKRTMYGRAGFDLLRACIRHTVGACNDSRDNAGHAGGTDDSGDQNSSVVLTRTSQKPSPSPSRVYSPRSEQTVMLCPRPQAGRRA